MFRSMQVSLLCEICGNRGQATIQFKTGFDFCEEYVVGDIVQENAGLSIGKEYPAEVDRVCAACQKKLNTTLAALRQQAEESLIAEGRLKRTPKIPFAEFPAEEANHLGRMFNDFLNNGGAIPTEVIHKALHDAPWDYIWDGNKAEIFSAALVDMNAEIHSRLNALLLQAGLNPELLTRKPIAIFLDEKSRIQMKPVSNP